MPRLRISKQVRRRLKDRALFPWNETGTLVDGEWIIPVSQETFDDLNKHRLPGEDDNQVLLRILDWVDQTPRWRH